MYIAKTIAKVTLLTGARKVIWQCLNAITRRADTSVILCKYKGRKGGETGRTSQRTKNRVEDKSFFAGAGSLLL